MRSGEICFLRGHRNQQNLSTVAAKNAASGRENSFINTRACPTFPRLRKTLSKTPPASSARFMRLGTHSPHIRPSFLTQACSLLCGSWKTLTETLPPTPLVLTLVYSRGHFWKPCTPLQTNAHAVSLRLSTLPRPTTTTTIYISTFIVFLRSVLRAANTLNRHGLGTARISNDTP